MDIGKITEGMLEFGFDPSCKGFNYLRQSVVIISNSEEEIKIMNIYSDIAKIFKTKPLSVEKAIRYMIDEWENSDRPLITSKIFPSEHYTNKMLINALFQYLHTSSQYN